MKLGHKARYPRPQSLLRDNAILRHAIPTDREPEFEWRRSFSGTPNLRMTAITNDVTWTVDFYCGRFYRAQIEGATGDVWHDLRSLAGYLRKRLNLGLLETAE